MSRSLSPWNPKAQAILDTAYAAKSWPRGRWLSVNIFHPLTAPTYPGVYAVYFDGEIVYIGQTNNLRVRLAKYHIAHGYSRCIHTPWGDLDPETKVTCKVKCSRHLGDWAMWEIRLLQRLRPRFNVHHMRPLRRAT